MTPSTTDPSEFVYTEDKETYSRWTNTNDVRATFKLLTHEKHRGSHRVEGGQCQTSVFLTVVVDPGQTIRLPAEYDNAIRKISSATGQVVGGLCPWLTKVGEEEVVVHSSLDYKAAFQEQEAMEMLTTMKKESDLRDALKEIERRKFQMEQDAEEKKVEKRGPGRPPGPHMSNRERIQDKLAESEAANKKD